MERILVLATSAFVFISVGVALVIINSAPDKPEGEPTAPPVVAAPEPQEARSQAQPQEDASPRSEASARNALEDLVADAPEYQPFFKRLQESFPAEYEAILQAVKSKLDASGTVQSVDFYVSDAIRLLRKSHGASVAKASPERMERVFDAQLAAMRAAASEDPRMCVGFLYGATAQDFEKMAASHRALIAEMAQARLEATADGEAAHAERPAPTEADVASLEKELSKRGLTNDELDVFLGGKIAQAGLDQSRMCVAGQSYLEALRALPLDVRMKIYSLLLEQMAHS